MGNQFCTSCGHSVAIDARFCENCGVVFAHAGLPTSNRPVDTAPTDSTAILKKTPNPATVVMHTRLTISNWVMPFNASLVFGATMVAVFDFLSPRIALLPIAATIAVVGLIAAVALRKFVAPSLPQSSAFRRALAPESGVHKSPVLIATGLLSALMVSGAAWSGAESASGGVIASKFDAARNAQMQLGVMQGLQKEQRVQTAVLEDIREGRTTNPRKELTNIGVLWSNDNFRGALVNGDLRVVQLFMDGGMGTDTATLVTAMFEATPAVQDAFVKSGGVARADACEQSLTASDKKLLQNPGELTWAVWRKACPGAESKNRASTALSGMLQLANKRYGAELANFQQAEKAHAAQQRKPFASVAACTAHELRDNAKLLIGEFERSDAGIGFVKDKTITARQMFLVTLWPELQAVKIIRDKTGHEPPAGFMAMQLQPKVEKFCQEVQSDPPAFTSKPPVRHAIESYTHAMARLGLIS